MLMAEPTRIRSASAVIGVAPRSANPRRAATASVANVDCPPPPLNSILEHERDSISKSQNFALDQESITSPCINIYWNQWIYKYISIKALIIEDIHKKHGYPFVEVHVPWTLFIDRILCSRHIRLPIKIIFFKSERIFRGNICWDFGWRHKHTVHNWPMPYFMCKISHFMAQRRRFQPADIVNIDAFEVPLRKCNLTF